MSSSQVFPYGITFKGDGVIDVFPSAKLFFPYKDGGEVPLFLLIDSGAYISALPKKDTEALGITKVENENQVLISGVSGTAIRGWRHEIKVRMGKETFSLPVVFLDNVYAPRILGRLGVFEKFSIIFEEYGKRSGFLAKKSPEAKSIGKIIDSIAKNQ